MLDRGLAAFLRRTSLPLALDYPARVTGDVGQLPEEYLQSLALRALSSACRRLDEERLDDERAYAPAGEALFWLNVCDDGYRKLLKSWDYEGKRDANFDGQILNGIRWARNRLTHQRALVVERQFGSEQGTVGHMKWARATTTPPGKHDQGREIYEKRMAGNPVMPALDAAKNWLYGEPLTAISSAWPKINFSTFNPAGPHRC